MQHPHDRLKGQWAVLQLSSKHFTGCPFNLEFFCLYLIGVVLDQHISRVGTQIRKNDSKCLNTPFKKPNYDDPNKSIPNYM